MTDLGRRYELGTRLGGGAMADVYRAHDRVLERSVALKVLRPGLTVDRELADRFDREADTISSIHHPSVVAVTDHGIADDAHYLAMELVDGPTLQQLLQRRGRLTESECVSLGYDIASGLAAAHAAGVIHRDLKPANILVDGTGRAKVGDFGIAHLESMTQLTRTGEVLGTPRYIAPEQISGRVNASSDVYSLGIVLYEMAAGQPPFDGASPLEIVQRQMRDRPVSPRALVPTLSRDLERIILRALEKDPARRFASAAQLRDALRALERAPVAAIAARRGGAGRAAFGSAVAAILMLTAVGGTAFAMARPDAIDALKAIAAATVASAASSAPVAAPTRAPLRTESAAVAVTHSPAPTPMSTPAPTPTESPVPTARPTERVALPTLAPARATANTASAAAATIARFYELVTADRFDEAAALWSAHMKASYPPSTNIAGRFSSTKSISLVSWSVAAQAGSAAAVDVDIREVMNDGSTRHWVGQWYVVQSGTAWLMDQPALQRV